MSVFENDVQIFGWIEIFYVKDIHNKDKKTGLIVLSSRKKITSTCC